MYSGICAETLVKYYANEHYSAAAELVFVAFYYLYRTVRFVKLINSVLRVVSLAIRCCYVKLMNVIL